MNQGRKNNQAQTMKGMINLEKQSVDPYLPRKCDFTSKVIFSSDRSSVQIAICGVDENGRATRSDRTLVSLSGFIRSKGEGHLALESILKERQLYFD